MSSVTNSDLLAKSWTERLQQDVKASSQHTCSTTPTSSAEALILDGASGGSGLTTSYYDRKVTTLADGARTFKTDADTQNELKAKAIIEKAWRCTLHPYPHFHSIDWYAERDHHFVANVELKSRSHASDKYSTVYLNFRKWLALTLAHVCSGVPSLFVVQFTDKIKYIDTSNVDVRSHDIAGTKKIVKANSDIEPIILVPICDMKEIA